MLKVKSLGVVFACFSFGLGAASSARPLNPDNGLIEQGDRVYDVQALCRSLRNNYAGWLLKKRIKQGEGYLLNYLDPKRKDLPVADGDRICDGAQKDEKAIPDPRLEGLSQDEAEFRIAKSNLEYSDRLLKLMASFKDTHTAFKRSTTRTWITYGISISELQGRYYLSDIQSFAKATLMNDIPKDYPKIGDEVLSWDGEGLSEALERLIPYQQKSTERAARKAALDSLTERNFRYPEKAQIRFRYRSKETGVEKTAELRLWYGGGTYATAKSRDDVHFLSHIGALSKSDLNTELSYGSKKQTSEDLFDPERLRNNLYGHFETVKRFCYTSEDEKEQVALVGLLPLGPEKALYIKIDTFDGRSDTLSGIIEGEDGDCKRAELDKNNPSGSDLFVHMKMELKAAAAANTPVILDLRNNGGGDPWLASKWLSLFLPKGQLANSGRNFNLVSNSRWDAESYLDSRLKVFPKDLKINSELLKIWQASNNNERIESDLLSKKNPEQRIFMTPVLPYDSVKSGEIFTSAPRLLAWTGPSCVSACEIFVMALADQKLAKTMGTPTSGTGMGMASPMATYSFIFPSGTHLVSQFPNFFFGRPLVGDDAYAKEFEAEKSLSAEERIDRRVKGISENRPINPHIPYEERIEDLLENGSGWIKASAHFFSRPVVTITPAVPEAQ